MVQLVLTALFPIGRFSDRAHSGILVLKTLQMIHLFAWALPNFMKVAPLYHVLKRQDWCVPALIHTGQHYDVNMSDSFFADLGLPAPDHHLGVGSGSHRSEEHTS